MSPEFLRGGEFFAAVATLEIVSVEFALPDPGVMLAGEKEQLNAFERPLQESEIGLLKAPDCACAVTVKVPGLPAEITTDDGDALKERDGVGFGGVGLDGPVAAQEGV